MERKNPLNLPDDIREPDDADELLRAIMGRPVRSKRRVRPDEEAGEGDDEDDEGED